MLQFFESETFGRFFDKMESFVVKFKVSRHLILLSNLAYFGKEKLAARFPRLYTLFCFAFQLAMNEVHLKKKIDRLVNIVKLDDSKSTHFLFILPIFRF